MTYNEKQIDTMTIDELREGIKDIWKQLARVRGNKLRDRLHSQREAMESYLAMISLSLPIV
jgi:ribosomal protein L29